MVLGLCVASSSFAKVADFTANQYAVQAPAELITLTEQVAEHVHFEQLYEVVVPTKAGLQVNPWNQFLSYGIDPQTTYPYILINPAWLLSLPENQQHFLLARAFATFELGTMSFAMKAAPYLFLLFFMLLMFSVIFIIARRPLPRKKKILAIVIAWVVVALVNATLQSKVQPMVVRYLGSLHDKKINELAVQKTGNKDAALQALESYDNAIQEDLKNGNTFWQQFEHVFKDQLAQLRQ